ncbi:MAG: EamA family transporter [Lentisphaerae bacterium]|nr:EamA family transporter [Lentisphaerota bacterium]MBT4822091.1 EamA family transporter [Lentisphaerota bacterium]MBT5608467.1 EamA family transporter [Lentisphaerota bacterium]MBT7062142.1 EamA family transporter [Lentisphaerota bacterium]MBT7844018.1 EamA family transporter [Lentisphaerota bacterium]
MAATESAERSQPGGQRGSDGRYILLGIGSTLIWCWSGVCFRMGADLMGSAMVYLTFMSGGGALTAVALQYARRQPLANMYRLPVRVIVAGFFGVALYTVMLATAFGIVSVSDIGQINLLNYLWPVWMVVLGILLLGGRPNVVMAVAGILTGLVGVAVSRGFDLLAHPPSSLVPHALALAGGFFWALYVVLLRRWKIPDEKGGTAFHFATCSAMAGGIAAYMGHWSSMPPWSGAMVFWVVVGAVGPVGIAYSMYEISVKNGPVLIIASLAYFIPIGSSALIGLFFKETMNGGLIMGAVLIAIGAWLVRCASRDLGPAEERPAETGQ